MVRFVNLTPHVVRLNNGTEYPPSGTVARVQASFTAFDADGVCTQQFGAVEGMPAWEPGTLCIVSALVLAALGKEGKRFDAVAPATGHPEVVRKDGQIYSVPGFVR